MPFGAAVSRHRPMILVSNVVADPADQITDLGAGALLRLERGDAAIGPFTEFATVALNATVNVYDIWDPDGDEDTWYQARFSEDDGTNPTAYGAAFQAGEQAYASRTDLLKAIKMQTSDARFLDRVGTVLAETTRDLIRELGGVSFFRSPTTGTEDVTFDGPGGRRLHVHGSAPRVGVVSVTSVRIRYRTTDAWTTLDAADWRLEGNPGSTGVTPGDPYFHVALTDRGHYGAFPRGDGLVQLAGAVFGWPAIQTDQREANVAWARQRLGADPSLPGGQIGPDEYGQPIASDRPPRAVYDLLMKEKSRHECWR